MVSKWCSFTSLCSSFYTAYALAADGDHGSFENPSSQVRPRFRYWLPDASVDADTVAENIRSAGAIGAGGVEFLPFYNYGSSSPSNDDWLTYGFGTPAFNNIFRAALTAHQEGGLIMDFPLGPNQGQGVPAYADNEGLQWDLVPFSDGVPSDGVFDGVLSGWGTGELVALVSAVVQSEQNLTRGIYNSFTNLTTPFNWTRYILQHDSLTDISSDVSQSDGSVDLTLEQLEGNQSYRLFSFYQKRTLAQNLDWSSPDSDSIWANGSYTVDHWSPRGAQTVIQFWEENILVNGTDTLLSAVGNYGWEDSVEIVANISWSPSLPSRFEDKFGYPLTQYLPIIMFQNSGLDSTGVTMECLLDTSDAGLGIRNDYRQALQDGYREYLETYTNWTHSRLGLQYSAQPGYNLNIDMASVVPNVDAPECESLGFSDSIDAYRQFTGAANLAGKAVISNEMGAVVARSYSYTVPELLFSFNRAVVSGINQVILHGQSYNGDYPQTTWPGYTAFGYLFSESYTDKQPSWNHGLSDAIEYMSRVQFLQRQGVARIDIAVLNTNTVTNETWTRIYQSTDLETDGWTYQYINNGNLQLPQAYVQDNTLAPDGPAWRALVADSSQNLTLEAIGLIQGYAASGLPVIFTGGTPGFFDTGVSGTDASFEDRLSALLETQNVYQVELGGVSQKLLDLSIRPRVITATNGTWFSRWREDAAAGSEIIFLLNDSPYSTGNITVSSQGTPYILDAFSGERSPLISFTVNEDNTTTIPFSLNANQSVIIEFSSSAEGSPSSHFAQLPQSVLGYGTSENGSIALYVSASPDDEIALLSTGETISLNAADVPAAFSLSNWTLVAEHWEHPDNLTDINTLAVKHNTTHQLGALVSWTEIDGLTNTSGIGYYSTELTWPPDGTAGDVGAFVALSEILHVARVFINGEEVAPLDPRNPRRDITTYLISGTNQMEIVVASTMWNYLRSFWDDLRSGGDLSVATQFYGSNLPPQTDNGLVGTVEIIPYTQQVVGS